jgi:hypothetical protein
MRTSIHEPPVILYQLWLLNEHNCARAPVSRIVAEDLIRDSARPAYRAASAQSPRLDMICRLSGCSIGFEETLASDYACRLAFPTLAGATVLRDFRWPTSLCRQAATGTGASLSQIPTSIWIVSATSKAISLATPYKRALPLPNTTIPKHFPTPFQPCR